MDCPHCGKPLTAVRRGLVILEYIPHPVSPKRNHVNINRKAPGLKRTWEEFGDGEHGVFYQCPHCEGDLSDLFDEDGNPTGPVGDVQRNVLSTLEWLGGDVPEDELAGEMTLTVSEIRPAVDALIEKGLIEQDTLPESHGEPRTLAARKS